MGYLVIGTSIQPYGRSNAGFRTVFYALNNILTALHAARVMSLTSNLYFNSAAAGSGPADNCVERLLFAVYLTRSTTERTPPLDGDMKGVLREGCV